MTRSTFLRMVAATAVLGVMVFALAVLVAPPIEAAASSNCTYYSNGSYTTVVGQFGYDCCNNKVAWGTKTKFSRCGGCFVCFPPAP
jgi:hypothetical protein